MFKYHHKKDDRIFASSQLTGSRIMFPPAEKSQNPRCLSKRNSRIITATNNNKFETPKLAQKSKQK